MTTSEGAVRPLRFLVLTTPATAACLGVVAGIVLGQIPVAMAAKHPIGVSASHGTADSLSVTLGSDHTVAGLRATEQSRGAGVVMLRESRLDGLCLLPRFEVPLLHGAFSLRITSSAPVDLGEVTLAAGATEVGRLTTTDATVTSGGGFRLEVAGPDGAELDDVAMGAYALVLDDGMRLTRLSVRAGALDQQC